MKAIALILVFALGKFAVLHGAVDAWSPLTVLAYFWQDIAVGILFGLFEGVAARAARGSQRQGIDRLSFVARLSTAVYWLLVGYAVLNIPVGRALFTPITWPMLSAARGPLVDSFLVYATMANAIWMIGVTMIAAVGAWAERSSAPRLETGTTSARRFRRTLTAAALLPVAIGPYGSARIDTRGLDRNIVVALLASRSPRIAAHAGTSDWRRSPFTVGPVEDLTALGGIARGRNVIVISLESTAAQYLRAYGGEVDATPNLDLLSRDAMVFDAAYAAYPESIKGLFSVLCSIFPAFDVATDDYAGQPCQSAAAVLAQHGYRTGMFHSGRFDYLGMQSVIRDRGFQTLEDAGDIGGDRESSFGVDEPSTVARMLDWIDRRPADHPFFLTYLPIAGHHPYETPERGPFPDRDEIGRYRNALRYGDASLGTLIAGLRARRLYERTLFVVAGDHGEAFGQHPGNFGHTFFIYDENVRVPLVVAAPGMSLAARRVTKVVSLVDLAPTILDLVALPVPSGYQGVSMLEASPRMALFFADYSLGLVGLRDATWKFIHEIGSGRSWLYDLDRDPGEMTDRSPDHADRVRWYRQHLLDWTAAQKSRLLAHTE